jgi:ABC-type phosphate/phosphonate transport system substrate-binding protein
VDAPFGHCPNCLIHLGCGPPPDHQPEPAVSRFGDYELIERVGSGGMGVVFKARQGSLKRLVALKMLNPQAASSLVVAERIRLEAEAAASLHHPHIVTIHEVGEHDGQPFFSMELVEGTGLDKLIGPEGLRLAPSHSFETDRRRGPTATAARLMVQIAQAVDYAHRHGVLHRDLKPANVIIDAEGAPHLTDFGLAKILDRERANMTSSGSILGTPAYMAPEQAAGGTKRVSTAADIYSLGAMFYHMLTGRPPFRADTPLETLRQVVEEEPKHPSTCNEAVDRDLAIICLKCLEKDPQHRYGSAQALAEDLERWLRQETIEARPTGSFERVWRWCWREPVLAGLTAGLFLLLTTTTLMALILYRHAEGRRIKAEQDKAQQSAFLFNRITEEWERNKRGGVRIHAEELRSLSDQTMPIEGTEVPVVLGAHLAPYQIDNPRRILEKMAPLANHLQTSNLSDSGPLVLFELCIYTSYHEAVEDFLRGNVGLVRLDPASYVLLRQRDPKIVPLAQQAYAGQTDLRGAIFTRTDSGITRLEDLKGRSFAFGDPDSAILNYLPKAQLAASGLQARDLAATTNLPSETVIDAVRLGHYDAGAADWEEVSRLRNAGVAGAPLHILAESQSPNYPWVASPNLDPAVIATLRQRLLSVHDTNVLAAVHPRLIGFQVVRPSDYDALEHQIEQAKLFEPDSADRKMDH